MGQYILIWGLEFFNAAATICCPYLARPLSSNPHNLEIKAKNKNTKNQEKSINQLKTEK